MVRIVLLCCFAALLALQVSAQGKCPPNIGFELGDFEGWQCSIGTISPTSGNITYTYSGGPTGDRQTIYSSTEYAQIMDEYGMFPVMCPNGSGYSIRLGNEQTRAQAEQVSYTFTIPQGQDNYSLIYHYAVVFQNPRDHMPFEQPKFTANVVDVATGNYIGCSSFSYTASSSLPGFKKSRQGDSVYYKEWTPVTIKLSGMAGKTIRLEFTTNDCTKGGHFGYAYIDVNQNCSSPVGGSVYCDGSEKMTLVAPYGFETYRWYTGDFSSELGREGTLSLQPIPPVNTKFALIVVPFPDQGCLDTLYTTIAYSPEPMKLVVKPDATACVNTGIDLTAAYITSGSSSNLVFSYFGDSLLTHFILNPKAIRDDSVYYIKAENDAGCTMAKPIVTKIELYPNVVVTDPAEVYRPATVDITKAIQATNGTVYNYTYWKDSLFTQPLPKPESINEKGRYFIKVESTIAAECMVFKGVNVSILEPVLVAPNIFTPNGDGINDSWQIPKLVYYPECVVEIFDRGGRKLYRSLPGYPVPWDGKYNNIDVPVGTYYYIIRPNKELRPVTGSITVVR